VMGTGTPTRFEGPNPSVGFTPSPAVKRRCGIPLAPAWEVGSQGLMADQAGQGAPHPPSTR
jgi:hypothetical protein